MIDVGNGFFSENQICNWMENNKNCIIMDVYQKKVNVRWKSSSQNKINFMRYKIIKYKNVNKAKKVWLMLKADTTTYFC